MFILIFQDDSLQLAQRISEQDLDRADDGALLIIDISDQAHPKQFKDGDWHLIDGASL